MKRPIQGCLGIAALLLAFTVQAKTASEVFDTVSSSIVVIRTYDTSGKNIALGSGVAVASDVIVTNCHVIKDAAQIQAVRQGSEYSASLEHSDWDRDVCTLTVRGINAPAVKTGSTSRLKVGARVYAVGAPQGLELTLSEGIISSLHPVEGGGQFLQISAPFSPGSIGGGLFDEEGRLIGLLTFYLAEGEQLDFAVPVEWIPELPKRQKETVQAKETTSINRLAGQKGWKKTITLPNGDVVCDLNGEWDALYENFGHHQWIGNIKDMLKITQKGGSFVGVNMIGTQYVPKDAESIRGELDKNGIKELGLVLRTFPEYVLECKAQISEDGNKIIIDGGKRIRATLTRK